jgi:hypothetical protein
MPAAGYLNILAAIEAKTDDKQSDSRFSNAIRGYVPSQLRNLAKRLFGFLSPENQAVASNYYQGAEAFVNLYWDIGEEHLINHGTKSRAFQADFRNRIRRHVRDSWVKGEIAAGRNWAIPDSMADEAVPADPAAADVHSAVHGEPDAGGVFPWLPGEEEFVRLGTVTVGNTGGRLEFAVDPHVTKELRDMCSENRPFIYIWLLNRGGQDEVLKIGLGGNGARDDCNAWKTLRDYCSPFSAWTGGDTGGSRLGVAKGIAMDLNAAAEDEIPAVCSFHISILPEVAAVRQSKLPGNVKISARSFEDGCVHAYQDAHDGAVPKYNLMEGGKKWKGFVLS